MSDISDLLAQILSATYGKEVRGAIHDSIEQCYDDVQQGVTQADSAASRADTATDQLEALMEELPDDYVDMVKDVGNIERSMGINKIPVNNFKFPDSFTSSTNQGVTITRINDDTIILNGTASSNFNIQWWKGYSVAPGVHYKMVVTDDPFPTGLYFQSGYFNQDNQATQFTWNIETPNSIYLAKYPDEEGLLSREYLRILAGHSFNNQKFTFFSSTFKLTEHSLADISDNLQSVLGPFTFSNNTTVDSGTTHIFNFPCSISRKFSITNKGSGMITINVIDSDREEHSAGNLSANSSLSITPDYTAVGLRCYVNGTSFHVEISFGGEIADIYDKLDDLNDQTEETEARVLELENVALTADDIFNAEPYTGEYDWQTPVVTYGALFRDKSPEEIETFAFFTDPHVAGFGDDNRNETKMRNYLKRVQKVYNATPCSNIVCGGDWLNNATTRDEACYRLGLIKGICSHMLDGCRLVMGNHDTNYQGRAGSASELHTGRLDNETLASIWYRDTDTKKAYYSYDGDNSKCYVLDTGTEHSTMLDYDWEQVDWLGNKLIEDDPEHAVIFLHIIVDGGAVRMPANNFASLVSAYNAHSNVSLNGVTYDFSSCTGHVDFWVGGHTHTDSTGTLGGIPYFITASNGYTSDVPLIDLVLADYSAGEIKIVRVGETKEIRTISLQ